MLRRSFSCFFSAPASALLVVPVVLVPVGVMAARVASRLKSFVCSEPTSKEEPVEAKKRSRLFFNWRVLGSRVRLRRRLGDSSLIVPFVYTLLLISGSRSRCCSSQSKRSKPEGASFLLSSRRCCCCVLTGWMLGARQQNSRAGWQTRQRQKVRHPEAPTSSRNVRGAPPPPASPVT